MYDADTELSFVDVLFSELKKSFITYVEVNTYEHLGYCIWHTGKT